MSEFGGRLDAWLNKDNPWENECPDCTDGTCHCDEDCCCECESTYEPDYEAMVEADNYYRNS